MGAMDAEMATGGRLSGLAVTTLEEHGSRHSIISRARPGTRHGCTHGTPGACRHTCGHCSHDILSASPKHDLQHVHLADHPTDGDGPTVGHNATKPLHQPTSPTWVVCTRARQRASGEEADAEGSDQTARSAQREQGRARSEGRLIGNNGTSTTRRDEYDGMGSSDGVDGDGIGGLHCAAKPRRGAASCAPRGGCCLSLGQKYLALVYVGWVLTAYVTFADNLEYWPMRGRRSSTRPSARVRRRARQRTRRRGTTTRSSWRRLGRFTWTARRVAGRRYSSRRPLMGAEFIFIRTGRCLAETCSHPAAQGGRETSPTSRGSDEPWSVGAEQPCALGRLWATDAVQGWFP